MRPPRLSIVTPVFNPPADILRATARFGARADRAATGSTGSSTTDSTAAHVRPMLEEAAAGDSRVHVEFRSEQGGIVAATNDAVELATLDFVAFMDHDDELASTAVEPCTRTLAAEPDESTTCTPTRTRSTSTENHSDPFLKPDWSPERLRSQMYTCHFSVVRRSVLDEVGRVPRPATTAPRTGTSSCASPNRRGDGASRARGPLPLAGPFDVGRGSIAMAKPYGAPGRAAGDPGPHGAHRRCRTRSSSPKVCPVRIPHPPGAARDAAGVDHHADGRAPARRARHAHEPRRPLRSAASSSAPRTRTTRSSWWPTPTPRTRPWPSCARSPAIGCASCRSPAVQLLGQDQPGRVHARGEYLLMLNDDIEVLARGWKDRSLDDVGPSDWLECLLGYATHPDIGSVGAKMYLGDRRLQHVGIISTSGSVPAHPYRGFHGGFLGYIGNAIMPCNYIAVTGACLMTRRRRCSTRSAGCQRRSRSTTRTSTTG